MKRYMAYDQYGNTFHDLQHPRKELMNHLGNQHCRKMLVNDHNGKSFHVGYVIGDHWLTVCEVIPWRQPI